MFRWKIQNQVRLTLICLLIGGCASKDLAPPQQNTGEIVLGHLITQPSFVDSLKMCRNEILERQDIVDRIYAVYASDEEKISFDAAKITEPAVMDRKSRSKVSSVLDERIARSEQQGVATYTLWDYATIEEYDSKQGVAAVKFSNVTYKRDDWRALTSGFGRGLFKRKLNQEDAILARNITRGGGQLHYSINIASHLTKPRSRRELNEYRYYGGKLKQILDLRMTKDVAYSLKIAESESNGNGLRYVLVMKSDTCSVKDNKRGSRSNKPVEIGLMIEEVRIYSGEGPDFSDDDLIFSTD